MKNLKQVLKDNGVPEAQLDDAHKAIHAYYSSLLPESISDQLHALEEGKPFNYRKVMEERLEELKDDAEDFVEEFSKDTEKFVKIAEKRAAQGVDELKSVFGKYFERRKGKNSNDPKQEGDDIKKAKEELDRDKDEK